MTGRDTLHIPIYLPKIHTRVRCCNNVQVFLCRVSTGGAELVQCVYFSDTNSEKVCKFSVLVTFFDIVSYLIKVIRNLESSLLHLTYIVYVIMLKPTSMVVTVWGCVTP